MILEPGVKRFFFSSLFFYFTCQSLTEWLPSPWIFSVLIPVWWQERKWHCRVKFFSFFLSVLFFGGNKSELFILNSLRVRLHECTHWSQQERPVGITVWTSMTSSLMDARDRAGKEYWGRGRRREKKDKIFTGFPTESLWNQTGMLFGYPEWNCFVVHIPYFPNECLTVSLLWQWE